MQENIHLEDCIQQIEKKLDWGPSIQWTAYHFSRLSQEIHSKTGKTVSDSTLKRLFGKKDTRENYMPQLYTRDAIAEFLGYTDWQSFVKLRKQMANNTPSGGGKSKTAVWVSIALVLVVMLLIVVFSPFRIENKAWLKKTDTLSIVPYTAVFHYDVSEIDDSVFIDFGDHVLIPLPKEKHTITEFYKACGLFYPRILTRKKVLDSVRVVNYSNGWQGGYSPNDEFLKFIPFEDSLLFRQDGRLYISPQHLKFADPLYEKGIYAEYRYMNSIGISLDTMELKAVVKNNPAEGGKLCYDAEIWLIGSVETCRIRFVEPGCFRYGQLKISEKEYNGRFDDLSALARDMKQWVEVGFRTKNGKAEITYGGEVIMNESYSRGMGQLLGIYFRFYGTGSVREVVIKAPDERIVYQSNFL